MNSINKIVKESGIDFTGSILGNILGYIWLVVLTRTLTQDDFGSFTLAQSVINISLIIVLLGTHQSLDRFIPIYNAEGNPGKVKSLLRMVFNFVFFTSIGMGILLFIGSPLIGERIFENPTLTRIFPITILSLPLLAVIMLVIYAFGGYKELRYHVYLKQLLEPGLKIGFAALLMILGWGVVAWAWLYVAALLITASISIWTLAVKIILPLARVENITVDLREIISYSWPISISSVLIIIVGQIDYLVLGMYHPAANVGIYRIYIQFIVVLKLIHVSISRIYKPVASGLIPEGNHSEISETYRRSSKWVLSLTALGLLIIVLYGNQLTRLLFTDAYAAHPEALVILALGTFFSTFFGPGGMTLEAYGRTRLVLVNALVMVAANLGLDFLLIPELGLVGAAIATGISLALGGLVSFLEVYYLYKIQPFSIDTLKFLLIGSLTGTVFFFLSGVFPQNPFFLVLLIVLTSVSYGAGLFASGSLDEIDRDVLRRIAGRLTGR